MVYWAQWKEGVGKVSEGKEFGRTVIKVHLLIRSQFTTEEKESPCH